MGTATIGRQYTVTIPIEPGDTQADVLIFVPAGCPVPPKARVTVQRQGEASISEAIEVHEVAA